MAKKQLTYMNEFAYDAFLWTFSVLVDLFFREVHPRGSWKIPKKGPVLFVCAPHANQVCKQNVASERCRTDDAHSSSTA
jgi:glycerol-3-phosphate O-acyltransferase/dihydroxyacetone phosphate acyltransferase